MNWLVWLCWRRLAVVDHHVINRDVDYNVLMLMNGGEDWEYWEGHRTDGETGTISRIAQDKGYIQALSTSTLAGILHNY